MIFPPKIIGLLRVLLVCTFLFVLPNVTFAAAPTVSSLNPADGSTGVGTDTNLVITFDQTVIASGGLLGSTSTITIFKEDATVIEVIGASSGAVTVSTATVTINPINTLAKNTNYYIQISDDAFENAAGEQYAGISDATTWNFRTIGGGAAANRQLRERLKASQPTYYDTEAPSLSDVGIYHSVTAEQDVQHTAAPEEEEEEDKEEELPRKVRSQIAKVTEVHDDAEAQPTQEYVSGFHQRVCERVERRFAGYRKMIDRINSRLQRRFRFTCDVN